MKREDLFEAIGAVDNEYLEHSEQAPKRGHRILSRIGLAAAAVALLCSTAMAFPAVREAVGEMLGLKTERGGNAGYVTIDGVTQKQQTYEVQPSVIPDEAAPTRLETVYRPTYMPEGYSEKNGTVWASYSGNEDCSVDYNQSYFTYTREADTELLKKLLSEENYDLYTSTQATAPRIMFDQIPAVDYAANPELWIEEFSGIEAPEMQTLTLGGVECQYVGGTEVREYAGMPDNTLIVKKQIVLWSDGDYVFVLRAHFTDLGFEELGRIIASVEPLADCSPYLIVSNADENAEHDAIKTVYKPASLPEGWQQNFLTVEGDNCNCGWSENETGKTFWLYQYSYRDASLLNVSLPSDKESRTINSAEVSFRKVVSDYLFLGGHTPINERLYAAWEKDGNYFVAVLNGEHVEVDELAELIASVAPDESINVEDYKTETVEDSIQTYYLPEMSQEWKQTTTIAWPDSSLFEWMNEDYAGVSFTQMLGEPAEKGYYRENTRVEKIGAVEFYINDGMIQAIWEHDGCWMTLKCTDGDTTKWTVDDVSALIESVHSVEDITTCLTYDVIVEESTTVVIPEESTTVVISEESTTVSG